MNLGRCSCADAAGNNGLRDRVAAAARLHERRRACMALSSTMMIILWRITLPSLFADNCVRMIQTNQLLEVLKLPLLLLNLALLFRYSSLLLFDLRLLLFDRVDEHDVEVVVLHAFNLTLVVVRYQQRLDGGDIFGGESEVASSTLFPGEGDRMQAAD